MKLIVVSISFILSVVNAAFSIKQLINLRLENLKKFASIRQYKPQVCRQDKFIVITEFQFGNTGNHIIEFAHGVWMAHRMNSTLIVPSWMQDIFAPFDITLLKKNFCFTIDTAVPKGLVPVEITSEESFFLPQLFHNKDFIPYLPLNMSETASHELSLHFLKVYAALWSSPLSDIVAASEWIIENHLDNTLRYTAVHKRQMEGGCSKIMGHVTKPSDFSTDEIPTHRPEWSGNLNRDHPLCTMPVEMVLDIQNIRHRNASKLYVAYDGAGEVDSYKQHGAVFASVLDHGSALPHSKTNRKFIDMFVAIHADLFILNPRSTFSWQIYLIRVCLGLESLPVIKDNDFYMQKIPEELEKGKRPVWVSWTSVIDAYFEFGRMI